jgi:hypothetical protein
MKTNQAQQDFSKSEVNALHTLGKGLYCLAYNFNLHSHTVYFSVSANYVM